VLVAGFGAIRILFYNSVHVAHYVRSVGVVNIITGVFCLLAAIIWCSVHNYWWGDDSKFRFKNALLVEDDPTFSACLSECALTNGVRPPSCYAGFVLPEEESTPGYMAEKGLDGDACFDTWNSTGCMSVRLRPASAAARRAAARVSSE
jgi:hypothetical protein